MPKMFASIRIINETLRVLNSLPEEFSRSMYNAKAEELGGEAILCDAARNNGLIYRVRVEEIKRPATEEYYNVLYGTLEEVLATAGSDWSCRHIKEYLSEGWTVKSVKQDGKHWKSSTPLYTWVLTKEVPAKRYWYKVREDVLSQYGVTVK